MRVDLGLGPKKVRGARLSSRPLNRRSPDRDEALALAVLYRLLATAFTYPDALLTNDVRGGLAAAARALRSQTLPPRLSGPLRRATQAWQCIGPADLELSYSSLFLASGPVALREGGYGDGMRFAGQPIDLADLNGFYLAFGFGPPPTEASPPDHLGTELEFMSLLYMKMAYAMERRRPEQVRITRHAMGRFLKDHLGRWVAALHAALEAAGAPLPYLTAGELLVRAVAIDCARLGIEAEPARAGTARDPVGLDDFKCPLAAEQPQPDGPEASHASPGA